jgi:hypothetical protein
MNDSVESQLFFIFFLYHIIYLVLYYGHELHKYSEFFFSPNQLQNYLFASKEN